MSTLADYENWKAIQQQQSIAAVNVVLGNADGTPDQVAADLNLADEFGKVTGNPVPPAPLVKEYRNEFQRRIDEHKNRTALSNAPRLTNWLLEGDNAAVARDDLQGLSWWETGLAAAGNALSRGVRRVPQSFNQFLANSAARRAADQQRSLGGILADQQGTIALMRDGKPTGETMSQGAGPLDFPMAVARFAQSRLAGVLGIDEKASASSFQQAAGQINKRISEIPMSPSGTEGRDNWNAATKAGGTLTDYLGAIGRNPGAFSAFIMETAAESLPMIGVALATRGLTGSTTAGAVAMGATSAAQEYGTTPVEFFAEKGIDVSTPDGAMKAISDPALMKEAAQRGVVRAVVVGAMDGLSGGLASQTLAKSHVGNMVLQAITQAAMGAAGEAGGQLASGQQFNLGDVLLEGLAEFATAPVEVAGMGGSRLFEAAGKAKSAGDRVALFQELSGQAQSSILRARMPEKFRQFVAAATANGPVENVYVPADQFVQYFQSVGVDPHELADTLDGVTRDDLDAALAGGGDLQIPTATYAAKIAGSDHDEFLMQNMRFDPSEFTAKEAAEFNARAQEAIEEAYQVADQARQEQESLRSHEQEIYDTMVSRLRAAGRSTDVATTEAMLYPAFYRVMAERSGMAIDEFMQKYPLPQVRGDLPAGLQLKTVDDLTRTLAEARNRKAAGLDKRQTLLEFISEHGGINDPGGELKARDAETIKRKGKKTLRLARGGAMAGVRDMFGGGGKKHGADDVARAAIEAGFMADDPVVQEYQTAVAEGREVPDISRSLWAAIDRELAGETQRAGQADPAIVRAEELDEIERYLNGLGVTLADDDAAIRAAVEKDQADAGKQYGQSGGPGPRGAIQFPVAGVGNGDTVIRIFETADLSTLLHESGHYFLTVMQDMAARGEPGVSSDMIALRDWWRSNAGDVAKDGARVMPDVQITADDVIAALENGTTGDVIKDAAVDVGMQEQFARGFEAYLMEGKAPSVELRTAFEKFRAWLISVYRRLAGLNVTISDDIRAVFDRMLATDDEIAKATAEAGDIGATFTTAEQLGLSPEQFENLMKLRAQSEDEAKARLLRETMAPIKRAKEKWFKEERAKVHDEVSVRINGAPVYRAIEWMGNRRWLGEDQPVDMPDMRMSKDILVDRYGEGILSTLPRGNQTVYAVEGGLDPDEIAEGFGFESGDEMVRAMERAPKRTEAIDAETDAVMRERHGDVLNDGEVEASALDAVHNDKRGEWLAAELKAISEVAQAGKPITMKEARASARAAINQMRVRDAMNANRFLAAERKAADEAARVGAMLARDGVWLRQATARMEAKARAASRGDASVDQVNAAIDRRNNILESGDATFTVPDRTIQTKAGEKTIAGGERTTHSAGYNENVAKLLDAKRRQLLNHALYVEARKVADEVEKAERFVNKLEKASHREKIAGAGRRENARIDYLAAIDEVLERYDFRRLSAKTEQRRGSLNAYIEAMTAAGRENELAIPESVLADAGRKPYKTMPVEEMRGVVATLKNLEHTALGWNDLIDRENKRKLDEVVTDIVAAFDANVKKRPPSRVASGGEGWRNTTRQFFDLVLNATTLLREIDGFKDGGPTYRNIKTPIDEAMSRLITRKEQAAADLEKLYAVYSKDERRKMAVRQHMPALGYALSKWERIAVALNAGNDGNLQRLTDPSVRGSMTADQVKAVLATLDERDANFIQSVWDYVGSFRADIAARERRTTGVEPAWVEATPIEIGGKVLAGGYYPIKYDPRLTAAARDDAMNDISKSLQAGRFGKAQTRNGHTKERAQSSGRAVELDMSVLHRHVNQVIYDLELSEAVTSGWRILQNDRVRSAFVDAGKQADFDALEIWLQDVGTGEVRSADFVGRASRMLKSNFTAAKLAFNLSTVAMQVVGVSQSAVIVGKKNMAVGVAKTIAAPFSTAADIVGKSAFMRSRQTTFNKDIYDFYSDPTMGPVASRWGDIKSDWIGPISFWLMTKVQFYAADVPTWVAAYEQGLKKFGNDEGQAIAHADDVVKRAQASGLFSDRSAIERGSVTRNTRQNDVVRLFTTLASYMFAKANVAYERSVTAGRVIQDEGVSLRSAQEALSWTIDMAFLFTLETVLTAMIKGQLPKGDDDDDTWLKFLSKQTALGVMGTVPFVRDAASALEGFNGGGAYGAIADEFTKPIKLAFKGNVDRAFVKSVISASGLATGLPATQINRVVDAQWRRSEGEDVSLWEHAVGRMATR